MIDTGSQNRLAVEFTPTFIGRGSQQLRKRAASFVPNPTTYYVSVKNRRRPSSARMAASNRRRRQPTRLLEIPCWSRYVGREPLLVIYEPIERLHGIGWPFDDMMNLYVKAWRAIAG
ncbi:MAG TPA: hypothetical protein VMR25_03105 [Planctomycetaceae bacterium]|jgi:hypothetical protein|nr:hypothetical protein [Planctomycetaceae bacterium]